MYCIYCGTELPQDARFCSSCGNAVQGISGRQPQKNNAVNVPEKRKTAEKPARPAKSKVKRDYRGGFVALFELVILVAVYYAVFQMFFGEKTITGKTVVETESKSVRLSAVPSDLRNHPLLLMRGVGTCEYLRDDVAATVVFVNDDESAWTQEEIYTFMAEINTEVDQINRNAVEYRVPLNLAAGYRRCTVSGVVTPDNAGDFYDQIIKGAGLPTNRNLDMVAAELEEDLDAQEAPLVFAFNKTGRSWARQRGTSEYMVLFQDSSAFYHELLHLFGAKDFYYPEEVASAAELYLGKNIMLGEGRIDALTAYLIGWREELSSDAVSFLNATKHLTQEDIQKAHEKEIFTGYGTKEYADGRVYTGNLERGMPNGYGTIEYTDGRIYTGDVAQGVPSGFGTLEYGNGSVYTGEMARGEPNGKGTMVWFDGRVYQGEVTGGFPNGWGIYTWPDGTVYEGGFLQNQFHGQGKITYSDGSQRSGTWNQGEYIG